MGLHGRVLMLHKEEFVTSVKPGWVVFSHNKELERKHRLRMETSNFFVLCSVLKMNLSINKVKLENLDMKSVLNQSILHMICNKFILES